MSNVKGRDSSQNVNDREESIFKQYEGDVFLKYDTDPDCTAIAVRENQIGLHTEKGKVGILIKSKGDVQVQGKLTLSASGKNITKGNFTENDQSWRQYTDMGGSMSGIPPHIHLHSHRIQPAYLYKWPSVQLVSGIKEMLEQFLKLF